MNRSFPTHLAKALLWISLPFTLIACNMDKGSQSPTFAPPQLDKVYTVNKIEGPISLTGNNSDSTWEQGISLTDFQFPWQDRKAPPTLFRALYDFEFLYFQFIVEDADVVLAEKETRDMSVIGSDRVELFFSSNEALDPYYTLEMDPKGRNFEAVCHLHRDINPDWSWPGLETVGSLTENGYILEGKLPLASLEDLELWQDEAQVSLVVGVFRAEFDHLPDDKVKHNWISWVQPKSERPDFHIPSAFGKWVLEE